MGEVPSLVERVAVLERRVEEQDKVISQLFVHVRALGQHAHDGAGGVVLPYHPLQ